MNVGPRTIALVSFPDNMTQCFLRNVYRLVSGNETNHTMHTYTIRSGCHFRAMINTESQCVTSAMQVTIAPSVVNAKIASAVDREKHL